jgi:hypothetical protein
MAIRTTQSAGEAASTAAAPNVRATQSAAEALSTAAAPNLRATQAAAEGVTQTAAAFFRVTQAVVEVVISNPSRCGSVIAISSCPNEWEFPDPDPFPFPAAGGPQFEIFCEIEEDWGEHGHVFGDGEPTHNTIQTTGVRRWLVRYSGLDQTQAAILDDHYESTSGAISFDMTTPRGRDSAGAGETITDVRYESYERPDHQKIWAQSREVKLIKYTN